MRADILLISPYHSSLALNRGGLPEGSSCHHSDPIRYVVRGASHPVISATVARPHRDQQEHAGYSPEGITLCNYTQLCDFVSQLTGRVRSSSLHSGFIPGCGGVSVSNRIDGLRFASLLSSSPARMGSTRSVGLIAQADICAGRFFPRILSSLMLCGSVIIPERFRENNLVIL